MTESTASYGTLDWADLYLSKYLTPALALDPHVLNSALYSTRPSNSNCIYNYILVDIQPKV